MKANGNFQYAGLAKLKTGRRKYDESQRTDAYGPRIRLLDPPEIAAFQQRIEQIKSGAKPKVFRLNHN